jgi:hypothetical protein
VPKSGSVPRADASLSGDKRGPDDVAVHVLYRLTSILVGGGSDPPGCGPGGGKVARPESLHDLRA